MDSGEAEAVSCFWTKLSMTDQCCVAAGFKQCEEKACSNHTLLFGLFLFTVADCEVAGQEISGYFKGDNNFAGDWAEGDEKKRRSSEIK